MRIIKEAVFLFFQKIKIQATILKNKIQLFKKPKKPECEQYWTTLYYGHRGSGKSLHQAKEILNILKYLDWLYKKKPHLNKAIVYSIQKLSPEIEEKYGEYLYYWQRGKDLRYCPRENCWKGKEKHRLHGCYLIFDDLATILPADNWQLTPVWLRKTFAQARHFGIRIVANCQDPFSVDVNFRRYTDMAYRFRKIFGSRDPDETKTPVKFIWGLYIRRKIKAVDLWRVGDVSEHDIKVMKERKKRMEKIEGTNNVMGDMWKASRHLITRKVCEIYDTTQDVPEYRPEGFSHMELKCIDPSHPNCNHKKVYHKIE